MTKLRNSYCVFLRKKKQKKYKNRYLNLLYLKLYIVKSNNN